MKWQGKVAKFGAPEIDKLYLCVVEHCGTKKRIRTVLQGVAAHDHFWETVDDSEIDEWNWDVISWQSLEQIDALEKRLEEAEKVIDLYFSSGDNLGAAHQATGAYQAKYKKGGV